MNHPAENEPEDPPEENLPTTETPPTQPHDPYAALRVPSYRHFAIGNFIFLFFMQMQGTAVTWELYERTHSAFSLGLVGLVLAIPIVGLALPAGHVADRYDRRRIMQILLLFFCAFSLGMAAMAHYYPLEPHPLDVQPQTVVSEEVKRLDDSVKARPLPESQTVPVYMTYALLFLLGVTRAFHGPSSGSILPQLVPESMLANATTWRISQFHTAQVAGPALAGWVISWTFSATVVYLFAAAGALVFLVFLFFIELRPAQKSKDSMSIKSMFAGASFVYENKEIYAAMMLDLFAVLLGGAICLLPVYTKDILHVGPVALGWLRAAPALGSVVMLVVMAHLPPMKRAGAAMLWSVVGFGITTIVFGFSQNYWLSFVMLVLTGITDSISVVVRHTLVMLRTPNHMRGRVSAVNGVFINLSNEMGEFESGMVAGWFGPVFAVVSGGVGTVVVVAWVAMAWPMLARLKKLEAKTDH